jgi:sulfite reductase (NADPH) flavoprotein alpha-component
MDGLLFRWDSYVYISTVANIVQVPTVSAEGEGFALTPSLAGLSSALPAIPENVSIILSATPQESVDLATLSYQITDSHVIHLFDHYGSSREVGHIVKPSAYSEIKESWSISNALEDAGLGFFDYAGDNEAHTAVVLLNGPLALLAKAFASRVSGFGVLAARVLRPWDEEALRRVLPKSVKTVHVLDDVHSEALHGTLFSGVLSALIDGNAAPPQVKPHAITPTHTLEFATRPKTFLDFLRGLSPHLRDEVPVFDTPAIKKLLFVGTPSGPLALVPQLVENAFIVNNAIRARQVTDHDLFGKPGGIVVDRILLYPKQEIDEHIPVPLAIPLYAESAGEADFLGILDQGLLKSHALLHHVKPGSPVLVVTSWTAAEVAANLPAEAFEVVQQRQLHLYTFNVVQAAKDLGAEGVEALLVDLAFLRLYLAGAATEDLVVKVARATRADSFTDLDLEKANAQAWGALTEIELTEGDAPDVEATRTELKHLSFNAILVESVEDSPKETQAKISSWHRAAKDLLFATAYRPTGAKTVDPLEQHPSLRPEIPDRTFLVTCTVNRRLTPLEYDRNVFHMEFDTTGTGLKYEIGEALGVHGWNDAQEALDFCSWYGVDPQCLITLPLPNAEGQVHTRTVFQALQQQVDLFGKPVKAFYTELAQYATEKVDKFALLFIGSPEGAATFKRLSEKETVTYADVLMRYPSARPPIEVLCQLIGDIKPRHYSIASSQAVVGNRVDLLIVTVDWVTPSGSPRDGQCTRYLVGMKPGQQATVSIKPSVMKLPPNDNQPLIMAGLGTGAAPFRAFLQYKAWLAAQGKPVGPVYYYFGSRHQSQEYLYGEEIEAFIFDGTITRAGLAFSRDGPKKVYIQSKMAEDGEALARMLAEQNGVFYLCGPTWPVGDVYETLVSSLVKYCGKEKEEAAAYLEDLKEEERYVLEVY